jgi:predicted nucleotidyltransferase
LSPDLAERIKTYLSSREEITFAYLFGSQVSGKTRFGSDLDIAVWFAHEPSLNTLGNLVGDLEDLTGERIDLVELNGLPQKKPKLAYNVVSKGVLLFTKDEKLHVAFKTKTFLHYLDFKPVIEMTEAAMMKRIKNGTFGRPGKSIDK